LIVLGFRVEIVIKNFLLIAIDDSYCCKGAAVIILSFTVE